MEPPELRLVRSSATPRALRARRAAAVATVVLALACAAAASWSGADRSRREPDPVELARALVPRILEHGPDDPGVLAAVSRLRARIGRRPLDATARALYAGLLLELATTPDEALAAVFHAKRAAALAPVTVPVVRSAATVLARCGEHEAAAGLIRTMFGYDSRRAARLLATLEPFLAEWSPEPGRPGGAVPGLAEAWMAWSVELGAAGRVREADAWVEATHARWPEHLPALQSLASRAVRRKDWEALGALLPPDRPLPDEPAAASLFAYRARLEAERGRVDAARADVARAAALAGGSSWVLALAGDAMLAGGDTEAARHSWSRALFELPTGEGVQAQRLGLLTRLARLEDAHGRPADALRAWRAVLAENPQHAEARARVDDLTGFTR